VRSSLPERLYDHHLSPAHPFWMGVGEGLPPAPSGVHVHNGFEIAITLSGSVKFEFGQCQLAVTAGDVGLCGLWEPHKATLTDPAGTSQVVVIFLPEFLASSPRDAAPWMSLFTAEPEHRPRLRRAKVRQTALAIGCHMRDELDSRQKRWDEMLRLDLLRLLLVLEREWRRPLAAPRQPDLYPAALGRIMPAVSLVHEDLSRRVSCSQAAEVCGFSEPRFRSLFRRVMGVGFGRFSLRARLGFAAHCLSSTGLPLQQVVEATGFADLSHFHRVFSKHFGCNPTRYREQARTERPPGAHTLKGRHQRFTSRATIYVSVMPGSPPTSASPSTAMKKASPLV